jgi:hypothetical protein
MKFVAPSTLTEYARQFWRRERDKGNAQGIQNLKAVERGVDPVRLLQEAHSYKLPRQNNGHVSVVAFINRGEVESLLVHDYMPNDKWMQERGLVPQPLTRQLGILAEICLSRGYFESQRGDRQIRYFKDWRKRGSLTNVLSAEERPLIEVTETGEHEIVDGWGRLLPFAALLPEGVPFEPFEAFYASPNSPSTKCA